MKRLTQLFTALDATPRTREKMRALEAYFKETPPRDAAWGLFFLTGQRLPRRITTRQLRAWAAEEAGLPDWLVDICYEQVGDLAETIALILPDSDHVEEIPLHRWMEETLEPMAHMTPASRHQAMRQAWRRLDASQRFLWHKLITGGLRVGVGRHLVARALAQCAGVSAAVMAHRLAGAWKPTADAFRALLEKGDDPRDPAQPYPFYLAHPLDEAPASLGPATAWQAEWKWDGIRAQLLRRQGAGLLWSRGDELLTQAFPEIVGAARTLPDGTVLDGELLAWRSGAPLPFDALQRRLGRRSVPALLRREVPVLYMAYDLLEWQGEDCRSWTLQARRAQLAVLLASARETRPRLVDDAEHPPAQPELFAASSPDVEDLPLQLSNELDLQTWEDLAAWRGEARSRGMEGVMIKRRESTYGVGRLRGDWWKWKVDPLRLDAVLIGAQPGHGRRAGLFTDYTFAVWNHDTLVPIAKAYTGLSQAEIEEVDAYVRRHTTGRFGPLRSVTPEQVFELAFDGVQTSTRHKAGLALRFPRIARWRRDKKAGEADRLETLRRLMAGGS